jgi:CheY-like chemotaxis protein
MIAESDLHTAKLNGLRILLVEDEAMVAMLVEGMLTALGCQVVEWVANIPAALNAIDTIEFDGALLDMNLSGAVVFPVAEVLAARGLPFVFVTGYGRTAEAAARFPAAHPQEAVRFLPACPDPETGDRDAGGLCA